MKKRNKKITKQSSKDMPFFCEVDKFDKISDEINDKIDEKDFDLNNKIIDVERSLISQIDENQEIVEKETGVKVLSIIKLDVIDGKVVIEKTIED